jgi:hypothetical protein
MYVYIYMHTFQPCLVSPLPFLPIASQLEHAQEILYRYIYIYIEREREIYIYIHIFTDHQLKRNKVGIVEMNVSTKIKSS